MDDPSLRLAIMGAAASVIVVGIVLNFERIKIYECHTQRTLCQWKLFRKYNLKTFLTM
jgi:hypothetical protein